MLPPLLTPLFFFLNDPAPPEFYTLPLHDALPILLSRRRPEMNGPVQEGPRDRRRRYAGGEVRDCGMGGAIEVRQAGLRNPDPSADPFDCQRRSAEHTSELQSPCNLVCRLLL